MAPIPTPAPSPDSVAPGADEFGAGVESVLGYVTRTAEVVPDGVRWLTPSYDGEPEYNVRLHNGAAGIALFLADCGRVTGNTEALELAESALRWADSPSREPAGEAKPMRGPGMGNSLVTGRAGIGLAWLALAQATGQETHLDRARAIGDEIAAAGPGPFLYVFTGAAGEGLFFLRLWEATRDSRYLAQAQRGAEWLAQFTVRDDRGCLWPTRDPAAVAPEGTRYGGGYPPIEYLGFALGVAGIGYFLARLHAATREARWEQQVREIAGTLERHAVPVTGGLNWPQRPGDPNVSRYQWCFGAPAVGLFAIEAYRATGDERCLTLARAAGEATFAAGDVRRNPSQCHGLSGNGGLFIDLFLTTGEELWLDRARDFGRRCFAYRTPTPGGDAWQADDPGVTSPDLLCGAAGVGHYFLRLLAPRQVRPLVS